MHADETTKIATNLGLSTKYLDTLDPRGVGACPGFKLFLVTVGDDQFLISSDGRDGIGIRLFFNGLVGPSGEPDAVEEIGPNPDVPVWEAGNPYC